MAQENNTSVCPKHTAEDGPSLLQNGDLVFQAHHVGWIVASFFTIIAVVTSAWLMSKHLQWYTNKHEQRYIVRILLLVPVYAIISLLSYFFWNHSTPLLLLRDGYESTVLTAFFYLLLCYLSPDETEQKALFLKKGLSKEADSKARLNGEKVKTWVFPLGSVKWKPSDGLYFLQWMKWGVLQYCVIRPLTTLIAVALEYAGLYCEASWGPGWGHVYLTVIVSISVTIAMYCLIQLYVVVSEELAPQRPLLKLFAIKAVVFLTFWQASLLSVLSMLSVIKDTKYMTAEDINIGIGALLETFEMMLFAFLHIRAFTYKVYRPHHHQNPNAPRPKCTPMLRSFLHAMDFRETFREIWQGWKYMWAKMRGREPPVDQGVKRLAHYESAFGKSRTNLDGKSAILVTKHTLTYVETSEKEFATLPDVHLDVAAEERVERQWLGLGDEFVYGLHREKSDDLEVQIERELERRGYGSQIPGRGHIKSREQSLYDHRPQRSWWRNVYDRISQSGQDVDDESDRYSPVRQPSNRRRHSKKRRPHRPGKDEDGQRRLLGDHNQRYEFDDPPPPSLIRQSRGQPQRPSVYHQDENGIIVRDDILSPLSVYTDHRSSHVHRQQPRDLASPPPPSSRHGSKQHRSSRRRDSENRHHSPPPIHDPTPNISHQMSPSMVRSADSLFGRVFPPSTGHGTSLGHGQNPPTQESHDHNIGLAGERSTRQAHVDAASTAGITVEIVDEVGAPEMSHHRESAFHRPELDVDTGSAASEVPGRPEIEGEAYATPPSDRQSPPKRSNGLRRNSAQVYSPADIARRRQSRQNSMPSPQRMPQPSPHTFYAQPDRYPDLRVTSPTPRVTSPTATPYSSTQDDHHGPRFPVPAASYSRDNLDSGTQPSYAGTPHVNTHPNDPYMSSEDLSRYPGLPSPRSPRTPDRRASGQPSRTYQPPGQFSPGPNDRRQWP